MAKKDIHPVLAEELAAGRVEPVQLPGSAGGKAEGYAYFEFLGGAYDGYSIRLYAPFEDTVVFNGQTYHRSPPKNKRSKRLTYRLEGYELPRPKPKSRREEAGGSDPAGTSRRRRRTVVTTVSAV